MNGGDDYVLPDARCHHCGRDPVPVELARIVRLRCTDADLETNPAVAAWLRKCEDIIDAKLRQTRSGGRSPMQDIFESRGLKWPPDA